MKLIWPLLAFASCTLFVSVNAMLLTYQFAEDVNSAVLPGAPRATVDMSKVYLPPMVRMQALVLFFDAFVFLMYFMGMPVFDFVKNKVPILNTESKGKQEFDFTSFVLGKVFVMLTKVSLIFGTIVRDWP